MMDTRNAAKSSEQGKFSPGGSLSAISVCLDAESAVELRRFMQSTPLVRFQGELDAYCSDTDDPILDRITELAPDICLVDFDSDRRLAIQTAERIHERFGNTAIFAVSSNAQPDLIIQAMRCGCSEYLVKPLGHDPLLEAVARVGGRKREKGEQPNSQVLAFIGAKGGAGVTTLATHLSTFLAKYCSRKTLLIDLHPDLGDVGLHLGLTENGYHFYQLVESVARMDSDLLHGFLASHPSGVDVLLAPLAFEPILRVSPQAIGQTIDSLRSVYEFIVVDCPPGLTDANKEILDRADQVYMVTVPEVSALRNVARYLSYFSRTEFSNEKVKIVLNRHSRKGSITDEQIEKAIQRGIQWKIPNAYQQTIKTINSGNPTTQSPASDLTRAVMAWANALGAKSAPGDEKAKKNRGLLGLMSK